MPEHKNDQFDDDALDRLLAQARWPEPGTGRIERMHAYWRQILRRSVSAGAPRLALVALAAGVLLATGAACWRWAMTSEPLDPSRDFGLPLLATPRSQKLDQNFGSIPPLATPSDRFVPVAHEPNRGRAPSRYEQVLLLSEISASRPTEPRPAAAASPITVDGPPSESELQKPSGQQSEWAELLGRADVESICRYLSAVAGGDRAALDAADDVKDPPIDLLFGCLDCPLVERRLAAALVLGHIDEPEVSWRLGRYVSENISRREALVGLLARKDTLATEFVHQAREDINLAAVIEAAQWQLDSLNSDTWR